MCTPPQLSDLTKSLEKRVSQVEESCGSVQAVQANIDKINLNPLEKEQWARANNIEIKGVPLKKDENLYDIAQKIGNTIECPVRKEDIYYVARVQSLKSDSQKSIIMALNNRYCKEEFIAAARKYKDLLISELGYTGDSKVFINDHLTLHNKALLKKAKELANEKNFRYIWVKHCKILARKSNTSPIFRIQTEKGLQKIV